MPATNSPIGGYIMGSPPQIETTGAPHSSTARRHSSSGTRSVMVLSYSRMRPQPVQVRLQACSGSSMSTMGKRFLIMGCGWRFSPVLACRMRNGFAASGWRAAVFCHSGRGRILFLIMYPARPAVIARGNFIDVPFLNTIRVGAGLHERRQREEREIVLVEVVIEIENLGKTGAGGQFFVPASVGTLGFEQILDAVVHAEAMRIAP